MKGRSSGERDPETTSNSGSSNATQTRQHRREREADAGRSPSRDANHLDELHAKVGNHQLQRMAQRGELPGGGAATREHRAAGVETDDAGPRADGATERTRFPDGPSIQRALDAEGTAATRDGSESPVPDVVTDVVSSPGTRLDESVRTEMEARMGDSFSDVRIHTGPKATAAAEAIDARAFTVGNHVAFNRGEYDPSSPGGKHVLAHELAHVRQQTGGAVSMLPQAEADLEIDPDPQLEREANRTARDAMAGEAPTTVQRMGTEMHVQRSAIGDAVSSAAGAVKSGAESVKSGVQSAYEGTKSTAKDVASTVEDAATADEVTASVAQLGEEAGLAEFQEAVAEDIQRLYGMVQPSGPVERVADSTAGEVTKKGIEVGGMAMLAGGATTAGVPAILGAAALSAGGLTIAQMLSGKAQEKLKRFDPLEKLPGIGDEDVHTSGGKDPLADERDS